MKRKAFAAIAVILVLVGLTMLIAPRISNRVGEQIAHTTIEDFKALKSKATSDETTEKDDSSENSLPNINLAADPSKSENDPLWQIEDEEGNNENGELLSFRSIVIGSFFVAKIFLRGDYFVCGSHALCYRGISKCCCHSSGN